MFLVRIDYSSPAPTTLAHVASIPSAGDHLAFGVDDVPMYVQRSVTIANPQPGQPVALIRLTE